MSRRRSHAGQPNYAGGKKPQGPVCAGVLPDGSRCGRSLASGPKTVIDGWWYCEECTYRHDYPDREVSREERKRALPIQEETLFPLPRKIEGRSRG